MDSLNQLPPLADRMRPRNLDEYIGQEHLVGQDKILRKLIQQDQIPSMIFWGPPGTGKTTLAMIIATTTGANFESMSATLAGVKDIRRIAQSAQEKLDHNHQPTILFIDEIHRFNKGQQDCLLPYVEKGTITLIGATTENPSFEVNSALQSRSKVFVLNPLEPSHIEQIINSALVDKERGLGQYEHKIQDDALEFLIQMSNADARSALNTLEIAGKLVSDHPQTSPIMIDISHIKSALQKEHLIYDKSGEEHYNTISSFIKSMRASNVDAALYYLARMVEAGEDPKFIARRMVIFASEDIGMAQPTALVVANEVFKTCETVGYPECQINLAHGTVYLTTQKKDRSAYDAYFKALDDVRKYGNLPIPLHLRNAPTKLMKDLGYGKNYEMYPGMGKSLLPDKLNGHRYYNRH